MSGLDNHPAECSLLSLQWGGGDGAPWLVDSSLADTDLTALAVNRRQMRIV